MTEAIEKFINGAEEVADETKEEHEEAEEEEGITLVGRPEFQTIITDTWEVFQR